MSVGQSGEVKTPSLRDALLSAYNICDERARVGRANATLLKQREAELEQLTRRISNYMECFNHVTTIYKNIKAHDNERKEVALQVFNKAITDVSRMIPDANMRGMHISISASGRVRIVNDKNQDINKREGGAVRTATGLLMRYICTRETGGIPIMLFDESFFTLSDATTLEIRSTLKEMSKYMLIIVIEQRRNVAEGCVDVEYAFVKDEFGVTHVRRTDFGENNDDN